MEKLSIDNWKCYIDDTEYTENELITWLSQSEGNKMKVKIGKDLTLLTKILTVRCIVDDIIGEIQLELRS